MAEFGLALRPTLVLGSTGRGSIEGEPSAQALPAALDALIGAGRKIVGLPASFVDFELLADGWSWSICLNLALGPGTA